MHGLNDYEVWKQRSESIRKEVEMNRLARAGRRREPNLLTAFWWELRRDAVRLREVFERAFSRKRY